MTVATSTSATVVAPPAIATHGLVDHQDRRLAAEQAQNSSSNDSDSSATTAQAPKALLKRNFTAPKVWMVVFGVVLALCAGIVDAVTLRSLGVFVTHVTGTVARVGLQVEGVTRGANNHWDVAHSVLLVGCFIFGSFLCGLVIPKNQVHFGGKAFYGTALLGNSCLLIAAACSAPRLPVSGADIQASRAIAAGCLAAMACGLQNAMCTMHFGAVVRTTHVTGTATDIGSTMGRAVMILLRSRGGKRASDIERGELWDDSTKLRVLVPVFFGFFVGAMVGAALDSVMGILGLLVPAIITGTTGLAYTFLRTKMKEQIKRFEQRRLQDELTQVHEALQRVHSLQLASSERGEADEDGSLHDLIRESLELMHDFEGVVEELVHPQEQGEALPRSMTV